MAFWKAKPYSVVKGQLQPLGRGGRDRTSFHWLFWPVVAIHTGEWVQGSLLILDRRLNGVLVHANAIFSPMRW
jgi:hypothetical protein